MRLHSKKTEIKNFEWARGRQDDKGRGKRDLKNGKRSGAPLAIQGSIFGVIYYSRQRSGFWNPFNTTTHFHASIERHARRE